jgi:hypothetical protein
MDDQFIVKCLYCGKDLPFLKRMTGVEFCSDAHRRQYQAEFNELALNRLALAKPSPKPKLPAVKAAAQEASLSSETPPRVPPPPQASVPQGAVSPIRITPPPPHPVAAKTGTSAPDSPKTQLAGAGNASSDAGTKGSPTLRLTPVAAVTQTSKDQPVQNGSVTPKAMAGSIPWGKPAAAFREVVAALKLDFASTEAPTLFRPRHTPGTAASVLPHAARITITANPGVPESPRPVRGRLEPREFGRNGISVELGRNELLVSACKPQSEPLPLPEIGFAAPPRGESWIASFVSAPDDLDDLIGFADEPAEPLGWADTSNAKPQQTLAWTNGT